MASLRLSIDAIQRLKEESEQRHLRNIRRRTGSNLSEMSEVEIEAMRTTQSIVNGREDSNWDLGTDRGSHEPSLLLSHNFPIYFSTNIIILVETKVFKVFNISSVDIFSKY